MIVYILVLSIVFFFCIFIVCPYTYDVIKHKPHVVNCKFPSSHFNFVHYVKHENFIPKRIYRTFITSDMTRSSFNSFPEPLKNTEKYAPEFEEIFFDGPRVQTFLETYYNPQIVRCFHLIRNDYLSAKNDFFKFLLIYQLGGVYLDLKSSVASTRFNTIIQHANNNLLVSSRKIGYFFRPFISAIEGGERDLYHLAAPKGHPVLKHAINTLVYNIEQEYSKATFFGGYGVLCLTGPYFYARVLQNAKYKNVKVLKGDLNATVLKFLDSKYKKRYSKNKGSDYWNFHTSVVKSDASFF